MLAFDEDFAVEQIVTSFAKSKDEKDSRWKYARFPPRDYQSDAIEKLERTWNDEILECTSKKCRRVQEGDPDISVCEKCQSPLRSLSGALMRGATGTGKTPTACFAIDRWLQRDPNNRAFVISHEVDLVAQFAEEVKDFLGISPGLEQGPWRVRATEEMPLVVVASRASLGVKAEKVEGGEATLVSRLFKFAPEYNWLVVVDEAHKYSMKLKSCAHIFRWFEKNPNSRRIGLTATPQRTDKVSLRNLFPFSAMDLPLYDRNKKVKTAVSEGWCVKFDQKFITIEDFKFENLSVVKGDFAADSLEEHLANARRLEQMCKPLVDLVEDRSTLVFSSTVGMARKVADFLNARAGKTVAKHLHGKVPTDKRNIVYAEHKAGKFQFLSVCGLCREAYNDPNIQAIAVFRPTKSRSLAEQMRGRGVRPLRGLVDPLNTPEERRKAIAESRKPDCMIVDLVGITGLADCATTAHVLARGEDDKYIDHLNAVALQMAQDEGRIDYDVVIEKTDEEIEKEKQRQIELERERELQEAREQEAMRQTVKLKGDVKYKVEDVEQGVPRRGVLSKGEKKNVKLATPKQVGYMRRHFLVTRHAETVSFNVARRVIGLHQAGHSADYIRTKNRLPDNMLPASARQLSVLRNHGYHYNDGQLNKFQAAKMIVEKCKKS